MIVILTDGRWYKYECLHCTALFHGPEALRWFVSHMARHNQLGEEREAAKFYALLEG